MLRPEAFERDPWGFARNQAGHAALGAVGALVIGPVLTLALYALWEADQYWRRGGEAWDCVEDWAFVAGGVAAVFLPWATVVVAAHLIAGALRRDRDARR